jgi:polyisoprenyl-phosphate glycosyltransferase
MQVPNLPQSRGPIAGSVGIVVPLFNEQRHVDLLAQRLTNVLDSVGLNWSVLFIDDGSRDGTLSRVRAITGADSRFGALVLSRNFGKEAAIAAGLRRATGDAVIVMDADSQHPPEIILQFIKAWRAGNLVVFGQRQGRFEESAQRRWFSHLFYRLFRLISETPIPDGATDFVLLDRRAVAAVNSLGERSRFTKGLCAWIGFRSTTIHFLPGAREGDASRFNFVKLGRLALDGISSFSLLPLKVWSYLGLGISALALLYALVFLVQTLLFGVDVPGFPSLFVSIMFLSGVQLISLGIIGEYLGRVYTEVKARPLFIVEEEIGQIHPGPVGHGQSVTPAVNGGE